MKIAIDARWILPEISGIGNYTRRLLEALPRLGPEHRYLAIFGNARLRDRTLEACGLREAPNVTDLLVPWQIFDARNQWGLPRRLARHGVDLFHAPNYMIPLFAFPRNRPGRLPCVVTIHDVIPLLLPDHAPRSRKTRLYPLYRSLMRQIGARADAIIAVSDASRRDILRTLGIPAQAAAKVRTVYNGVSGIFCPGPGDLQRRAAAPDAARPRTLLYVGRFDPYKNVVTLIRAFARVRAACAFPTVLRLVGTPDPRYPESRQEAARLGVEPAVEWTGYLEDPELVAAYRRADVLVHPSRYEGFGMQVVEAMACGLPVVCSPAGSLREIAGGAALLVDPDDPAGMADAIRTVLTRPSVAGTLAREGVRRAARFTWERAAAATLAVYRETAAACQGRPAP